MEIIRVSGAVVLRITDERQQFVLRDKAATDRHLGVLANTVVLTDAMMADLWQRFSVTPQDIQKPDTLSLLLLKQHFAGFCRWFIRGEGFRQVQAYPRLYEKLGLRGAGRIKPRLWKHAEYKVPLRGRGGGVWMYNLFKIYNLPLSPGLWDEVAATNRLKIVTASNIRSGRSPQGARIPQVCRILL